MAEITRSAVARVRGDEVACDQPRIQTEQPKPPSHMVCATAGFHGHQAARGQLGAPGEEAIRCKRLGHKHVARSVHRMDLEHPLGQIHP